MLPRRPDSDTVTKVFCGLIGILGLATLLIWQYGWIFTRPSIREQLDQDLKERRAKQEPITIAAKEWERQQKERRERQKDLLFPPHGQNPGVDPKARSR